MNAVRYYLYRYGSARLLGAAFAVLAISLATLLIGAARADQANFASRAVVVPLPKSVTLASIGGVEGAADQGGLIRLQDLSPDAARAWNAALPISDAVNPPAKPFKLTAVSVLDEARAVDCMTAAVYYEAGFESLEGARAVAQVVINRLRNPLFPKTVCGVVFEGSDRAAGCQFTFTCDGALARTPQPEAWARAREVAAAALHGYVMPAVGNATHYHASYVAPYWSPSLVKVAVIGQHIFYRWTGGLGLPPAFAGRYAGGEMKGLEVAALDDLASKAGRLTLEDADAKVAPEPAPQRVAAEEAAPAPAAVTEAQPLVVAQTAVANAVVRADDLDWQGRPRQKGPPRLARPGAFAPTVSGSL